VTTTTHFNIENQSAYFPAACIGRRENSSTLTRPGTCMTILIVDDNDGMRRILRRALPASATSVFDISDGSAALAAYTTIRPDLVLMDIRMPIVDGLAATRSIRGVDPNARIIIVTDYDDEQLRAAAAESGACAYFLKQNLTGLAELIEAVTGS
jgi:two-component system response regulator DegU